MIPEMISSDRSRATATRRERNRRVSFLWISIPLFRSTNFSELHLQTRCFYTSNRTVTLRFYGYVRRTSFPASLSGTFIFLQPSSLLLSPLFLREISTKSSMCRTCDFLSVQDEDDRSIVARKTIAVTYTELVFRRSFRHSSSRTFHTRAFQSDPSCFVESVSFYREVLGALLESLNYRDANVTSTPNETYRYLLIILDSRSAFLPIDQFSSAS